MVQPAEGVHGVEHERVAVVDVAAGVRVAHDLAGVQAHVVAVGALDVEGLGLTAGGVPEQLLARELELDAAAAELLADPGVQGLVVHVLLRAETAADVGLDDADVAPGDAERLADDAAHHVRDLGRGDADELAALLVAVGDAGLDVDLGLLAALGMDLHVVVLGVLEGLLDRLVAGLGELVLGRTGQGVRDDVVGLALLDGRVRALHGLDRVVDDGVLLVLDLDELERAVAGDGVLAHDDGDVVAVDAHTGIEQLAVGLVALRGGGIGVPRVAGDRVADVGHVEAGVDGHDARDLERLARVDRQDLAVADRGMQQLCLQARLGAEVIGELRSSRDLVGGVHALDGTTDLLEPLHMSFPLL